jgi:hypothetical protein
MAADHASDFIVERDLNVANGGIMFRLLDQKHMIFTATQRADLRTAALQGWTALRTAWVAIHGTKAETYLDSLSTAQRDGWVRQLSVDEIPEPPG